MQVDLSSLATPVEPKKRVYKKRKIIEGLDESVEVERPQKGGKSIKSFPVKEKKPPTEKQLAAREKMRLARAAKVEQIKAEKAKLDEEIRLKEEEVKRKKEELAERRRLKREEKKAAMPQKPVVKSELGKTGEVEDRGPTIAEALKDVGVKNFRCGNENTAQEPIASNDIVEVVEEPLADVDPKTPVQMLEVPSTPTKPNVKFVVPNAPKREYVQRFRSYPFGKSIPAQPRFR